MTIEYKNGDMFNNTNRGDYLLHACNCRGSWGHGIAAQFKKRYPKSNEEHKLVCHGRETVGTAFITSENVICLFTSDRYGRFVDPPEMIVKATYKAIKHLLQQIDDNSVIHSPKINAGLFAVPWKYTEQAIEKAIEKSGKNITWIVWEL